MIYDRNHIPINNKAYKMEHDLVKSGCSGRNHDGEAETNAGSHPTSLIKTLETHRAAVPVRAVKVRALVQACPADDGDAGENKLK